MIRKPHPASNPIDDRLFNELYYRQQILDHANPIFDIVTPTSPSEEIEVAHGLGRVPRGYLVIAMESSVTIYNGDTEWTDTHLYLKADTQGVECTLVIL